MALIVHIGSQKTGSTAIQSVLAQNRDVLLGAGVDYLIAGRSNIAHNTLAQDIRHGDPAGHFAELAAEGAASSARDQVISSEMLFHEAVPARLRAGLVGDVRVLCYLRRHDLYLEAMYKQLLKNGKIRANPVAFLDRRRGTAAYGPVLDAFADAFGADAVQVRVYEPGALLGGDVVTDFLDAVGVGAVDVARPDQQANQTLSAEVSEVLGEISRNTRINTRPLIRELISGGADGVACTGDAFAPDARRDLMAQMAQDCAYIRDVYCPGDGPLFADLSMGEARDDSAEARLARHKFALSEVLAAFGRWRS